MARSDLIVSLVKASTRGDKTLAEKTIEALIAEERAKHHHVFADKLDQELKASRTRKSLEPSSAYSSPQSDNILKARDYIFEIQPSIRIDDLILSIDTRHVCEDLLEEQRRSDILRSHSLEPRHKILLAGPPGNGKTSLAEAIAESLGVPFFVVRYEALIGSYLGETSERLRRVFDYARTTPCVLFFDEFDAIGKERGDTHETGEIKRVVSSLLMQVDKLPSYTVVIAATNHPELLDRAAWRRFQIRVELPAPTLEDIAAYIGRFSFKVKEELGYTPLEMAKKLGTISYSEVEEFCKDIQRRTVLTMGGSSLRTIIGEQLKN